MRKTFVASVLVLMLFGNFACVAEQAAEPIMVHRADGDTIYDDEDALCVHRPLPARGADAYTVLILERIADERRLRFEINVVSETVQCTVTGSIHDFPYSEANYIVRNGNLWLTPAVLPVLVHWSEFIRACQ